MTFAAERDELISSFLEYYQAVYCSKPTSSESKLNKRASIRHKHTKPASITTKHSQLPNALEPLMTEFKALRTSLSLNDVIIKPQMKDEIALKVKTILDGANNNHDLIAEATIIHGDFLLLLAKYHPEPTQKAELAAEAKFKYIPVLAQEVKQVASASRKRIWQCAKGLNEVKKISNEQLQSNPNQSLYKSPAPF